MTFKALSLAGEMLMGAGAETPECRPLVKGLRRQVASRELFLGSNELQIEHNGEVYTLRLTSKGKLILTK